MATTDEDDDLAALGFVAVVYVMYPVVLTKK